MARGGEGGRVTVSEGVLTTTFSLIQLCQELQAASIVFSLKYETKDKFR